LRSEFWTQELELGVTATLSRFPFALLTVAYVQLSSWDATVKFWPLFDRYTWQKIHNLKQQKNIISATGMEKYGKGTLFYHVLPIFTGMQH